MATLKITPRMKVKTIKKDFAEAFGATLRVYTTPNCRAFADDDATLDTLMGDCKGGEATFEPEMTVDDFEKKVAELYGIGVQVANADNSRLSRNDARLDEAGKDHSASATLVVSPRMKVKTLKKDFKEAFGLTLRVYTTTKCNAFADDDALLSTLMGDHKRGEADFGSHLRVSEFEKLIEENYGIGVQVANAEDTKLCSNDLTLGAAANA